MSEYPPLHEDDSNDDMAPVDTAAAGSLGGRFDLHRLLKRGNGVETYEGLDSADGSPVIVKMVDTSTVSSATCVRLEHEARVLECLGTGAFRPLLASGRQGEHFFLVQLRLDGRTLGERLEAGPLSLSSTLQIAVDVLGALQMVHDRGVLHRDVKPANIMVRGVEPVERADLIDFGLARSANLHASLRDEPVGTARYLAPEAAGLVDLDADESSDLYALGVVLFECLAGQPPFTGTTVSEVLRHHLNTTAPHLRALGVHVPEVVDEILQRLLTKDPSARYRSAAGVLADFVEVRSALGAGIYEPSLIPGLRDQGHGLAEGSFIGRAKELATLAGLVNRSQGGAGGLVVVEAESGGGKSRLLDEIALQAGRLGLSVLRGQGTEHGAQRPFQLLDGVVRGIVRDGVDASLAPRLLDRLGDRAAAAATALPGLAATLGVAEQSIVGPETYGEARSIDALSVLLDALGQMEHPVLVLLDDCQWADALTVSLLGRWQDALTPGARHVLVVVAFRSEEVGPDAALRALKPLAHLELSPFGPGDVGALCASMAGPLPPDAVGTILRLADGSPFKISAVLRGIVESGALVRSSAGWEVDPGPMRDVQTSRQAALFLARRFELLDAPALALLGAGAVLGKEFDLDLAVALTGQSGPEVASALDEARRRRILWVAESDSRCSFTHHKLRATLLDRLGSSERTRLHCRVAELIEAGDPERVFEPAYHFDAGGQPRRALPYALRAAEEARARYALDAARTHYRIAERAAATTADTQMRRRVAEGLGDVLTLQGEHVEACLLLNHALSLSSDPVGRAVLEGKLGDVAFKAGEHHSARAYLGGALRDLGRWGAPRNAVTMGIAAAKEILVQVLHTLLPPSWVGRRPLQGAEREFMAIRMYSRLAYVYWFNAGKVPCLWAHLRGMNMAERFAPSPELAQAYSEHGPVMTMLPWYARAMRFAQRSLEIRREAGDMWGEGQSLDFLGVVLYSSSRYRECIEECTESRRLLERTGDRWEHNTATWHLVFSHYRLGELDRAVELARELYADASAIGDHTAAGVVLSGWARAAAGDVPAGFVAAKLGRTDGDAQTACEVHLADGVRLLAAGELDRAVERLEQADALVAAAGLRQEYVAPVKPWLATALRLSVEATGVPAGRRQMLSRAARAARQAVRLSRCYRNNRPHALRERALVAGLQGHRRRAERLLTLSLAVAARQGAAYEIALTRVATARAAAAGGRPGDCQDLARAEADKAALEPGPGTSASTGSPAGPTVSLADRFDSSLVVGRRIGAAASREAVYNEVRGAALLLMRGEQCHLVEVGRDSGEELTTASGENVGGLSRELVRRATGLPAPVVYGGGVADSNESLLLAGLRSVLCAPIESDGQVVACFYVTHRRLDGLFGDTEVQLAEFIATLGGAALEHVAGSEARFRSLAKNSSDVITILDPEGLVTYQSSSVEHVFGYQPEDMVGREIWRWLDRDDAARLRGFLDSPGPDKFVGLATARLRHSDGTWRHIEVAITNMFDEPEVGGLVLNTRDVTRRVALEEELQLRASRDPLTGLPNRDLFTARVDDARARCSAGNAHPAVVYLDLDNCKAVNDTLGHPVGDLLLKGVGDRLVECVRPGDTVARFGGDEFALLLEEADSPAAEVVAHRILAELGSPFRILDQEVHARASIGVALAQGTETTDDLLSAADTAVYVAKSRGRSRYEFFELRMRDLAVERSMLRSDLEWALPRDELVIHYQPVVHVPTGEVRGFEALLRWDHPTRGQLAPGDFIDLAEESGLIVPIGAWVLRQACRQGAAWRKAHRPGLTMAVNVSARQLQDPGLFAEIDAALREACLDPGALVLELTENAIVDDTEATIARLEELKAIGVGLAIDDFGTGYSSLSYLRRFPVDQLKVDRSFVAGVSTSPKDLAIVKSVVDLAHALGMSVVAEGVETLEQLGKLCGMGCDLAQGFNWPLPAEPCDVGAWLALGLTPSPGLGRPDVRVMLVDDQDGIRATLRIAFGIEDGFCVVGDAPSAAEAIVMAERLQPDLILLDVEMPGTTGIEALPALRSAAPDATVVLLTSFEAAALNTGGADRVIDKARALADLLGELSALVGR